MTRFLLAPTAGLLVLSLLACGGFADLLSGDDDPVDVDPDVDPDPTAPEELGLVIEALIATSGTGVEAVIDGDDATSWTPAGDPDLEGILLRLVHPETVTRIELAGCGKGTAEVYLDGTSIDSGPLEEGEVRGIDVEDGAFRSVFVRLAGDHACLGEIRLLTTDGPIPLAPPRTVPGELTTSSVLTPEAAYRPAYLFDGRNHFGWVEGVQGNGEGQTITVHFDDPTDLSGLELWNGYQRSADHFAKNARLAQVAVKMDGGDAQILDVGDTMGQQVLTFDPPLEGQELQIEVVAVHKGSRYSDLVVSEIRFVDDDGSFTLATDDLEAAESALVARLGTEHLGGVLNKAYTSRCGGNGRLKLRADASFVWYESGMDADGSVQEVFEGAWADKSLGTWSEVELYGRRHRVSEAWQPYGEADVQESTRVSGGTVKIGRVSELGKKGVKDAILAMGKGASADRVSCMREEGSKAMRELVQREAIFVTGTAITDLLWLE